MRSTQEYELIYIVGVVDGLDVGAGDEAAHGVSDEVYFGTIHSCWSGGEAVRNNFGDSIFQDVGVYYVGIPPLIWEGKKGLPLYISIGY